MRLDRFLAKQLRLPNKSLRAAIEQAEVLVDGQPQTDCHFSLTPFSQVQYRGQQLPFKQAYYWMLHKPAGVVSATKDKQHKTVCDLVDCDQPLHIVGRLDKNTTGLLLLTNDGMWSKALARPERRVSKTYLVTCNKPIPEAAIQQFKAGMYFASEQLTLLPADLELLGGPLARLTLYEGRYHQIKRMFGRLGIGVVELHREAVGGLQLDPSLAVGQCRELTEEERRLALNSEA